MLDFTLETTSGSFRFRTDHATLGRDPRCSFVLPDASVLRLHAALLVEEGRLYIEKRHLDALTFVNRAPIHHRVELYDGDLIDIGPWTLVLRSTELARRPNMPSPADLSLQYTPSDQAIVRTIRLPGALRSADASDDTSGGFII